MKKLQFSVKINTNRETIWFVLWDDQNFRDWANIIDEGTYMKGEMKEGNEVQFISSVNGYGVTSLIAKLLPYEYVLFKHKLDTKDTGNQTRDKQWTDGSESYMLSEIHGISTLVITTEVPDDLIDLFQIRLPMVLERIKILAEKM